MHRISVISLFFTSLVLNALINYGGIRSPDSEIVFRVGQSLEARGTFEVEEGLKGWERFGVARGKDEQLYGIFGPAESLLSVPLIKLANRINRSGWYRSEDLHLPVSHYIDNGLARILTNTPPNDRQEHATRLIVSFLNSLVTALGVALFWSIVLVLSGSLAAANVLSVLYAFGSLSWPYAGTYFSEPLATLFSLAALLGLVWYDSRRDSASARRVGAVMTTAGLSLGIAVAAHITAVLFAPFFLVYLVWVGYHRSGDQGAAIKSTAFFLAGMAVVVVLLGYYNFARFGSVFESGRSVGDDGFWNSKYSHLVAPWRNVWDLLFSSGKGLLWFCPLVIIGFIGWPRFHRKWRFLSWTLLTTVVLRLVFIASRSDWHGGFSLGPRYLVMLIPFLLLPASIWLGGVLRSNRSHAIVGLVAFAVLCISQQAYFCLGDVFEFLHKVKLEYARQGLNIFHDDMIYREWSLSPLMGLLSGKRGPFFLQNMNLSNGTLWMLGTIMLIVVAAGFVVYWLRSPRVDWKAK